MFSDTQKEAITLAIIECYKIERNKKLESIFYYKKKKTMASKTDHPWTGIAKWIGSLQLALLYEKIKSTFPIDFEKR